MKKIIIILIVLLLVASVVLGAFLFLNQRNDTNENVNQENTFSSNSEKTKKNNESDIQIGDYIAYNEGTDNTYVLNKENISDNKNETVTYSTDGSLKWRVFSIDDGQISIICDTSILPDNQVTVKQIDKILDDICSIYGNGYGAESARSINLEDIHKYMEFTEDTDNSDPVYRPYQFMDENSPEFNMLFKTSDDFYKKYYLNNSTQTKIFEFDDIWYGQISNGDYAVRSIQKETLILPVLPIVTLSKDIEITEKDENDVWQIKNSDPKPVEDTEEKYTKISSVDDFLSLANGDFSSSDNYILTTDLDLTNEENYLIEDFSGIFDGDGHKITGINITISDEGDFGLFKHATGAIIKNLDISDSKIELNGTDNNAAKVFAGILVGRATNSIITNCNVNGEVTGSGESIEGSNVKLWRIGLLGAEIKNGFVKNCSTEGNMSSDSTIEVYQSGFIDLITSSFIENCNTNVNISSTGDYTKCSSGFTSRCADSTISKCSATGTIIANSNKGFADGFIFWLDKQSAILRSYSTCDVTGSLYAKGFYVEVNEWMGQRYIVDCYYIGNLSTPKSKTTNGAFGGSWRADIQSSYVVAQYTNSENETKTIQGNDFSNMTMYKDVDELDDDNLHSKDSYENFSFDYVWKWDKNEKLPVLLDE